MPKTLTPPDGWELGGLKPKIKSQADLATAVAALAWMQSLRKRSEAETEQQINLLREQQAALLKVEIEDSQVGFDQREKDVTEAIVAYVLKYRAQVFEPGTKTTQFPAGSVALKDKPASLGFDGVTRKEVTAMFVDELGLVAKIGNWLKRLGARPWITLKPDLDVAAINAACKAEEITADELAEYHLTFEAGESVVIKPADYSAAIP